MFMFNYIKKIFIINLFNLFNFYIFNFKIVTNKFDLKLFIINILLKI